MHSVGKALWTHFCRFERMDWTSITVAQCDSIEENCSCRRRNSSHRSNISNDSYISKMR